MLCSSMAYAFPALPDGQFFGSASAFQASEWSYSGTLPSSLNAGFRAENVDNFCVPFIGCTDGDKQYSNGSRSISTTTGASPAYTLSFRGEFETENQEAWEVSLLDQSKGKLQTDVDRVNFVNPGAGVTNEHPIPSAWQSLNGYANPDGSYAQFDKTYQLAQKYLLPGESGCPLTFGALGTRTGVCSYTAAYFKGGADLSATIQGSGSIENTYPGSQSVTVDAKANRITTLFVNGSDVATGVVNGSTTSFSLEEERVRSVDLSFSGSFQNQTLSVGVKTTWDGRGETSSIESSYVTPVRMSDYEYVGKSDSYLVQVRDTPQLGAGLSGTDFYKASVLASSGLSAVSSSLLPVYQPVAGGRLVVKDAHLMQSKHSPQLRIPQGGFASDFTDTLRIVLSNEGSLDLTLDGFDFVLEDDDVLFDDTLTTIKQSLDRVMRPDETIELVYFIRAPASSLNAADGLLEGDFLELIGDGAFTYHDINGTRTAAFSMFVPEPPMYALLLMGGLMFIRRRYRNFQ